MLSIECNWETICLIVTWLYWIDIICFSNAIKEIRFFLLQFSLNNSSNNRRCYHRRDMDFISSFLLFSLSFYLLCHRRDSNLSRWVESTVPNAGHECWPFHRYVINYVTSIWFISFFSFLSDFVSSSLSLPFCCFFLFLLKYLSFVCIQVRSIAMRRKLASATNLIETKRVAK